VTLSPCFSPFFLDPNQFFLTFPQRTVLLPLSYISTTTLSHLISFALFSIHHPLFYYFSYLTYHSNRTLSSTFIAQVSATHLTLLHKVHTAAALTKTARTPWFVSVVAFQSQQQSN
jgi:hypothetical protein